MMPKPCEIPGCPALSEIDSRWCAVHRAMSEMERTDANAEGKRRQFHSLRSVAAVLADEDRGDA